MKFENITKKYGDKTVFSSFDLEIADGKITALFGGSGVGKTTLLNIVAGLTEYQGTVSDAGRCSYIFQEQRLIPTLTVAKNLDYVLPRVKGDKEIRKQKISEILEKVGLAEYENVYPNALSGGQAQRVAIARAFLYPSQVLLMDEPFRGLDVGTKDKLMKLFLSMWKEDRRTVILVTHGIEEGLLLADDWIVLGDSPARVIYRAQAKENVGNRSMENLGADYAEVYRAICGDF